MQWQSGAVCEFHLTEGYAVNSPQEKWSKTHKRPLGCPGNEECNAKADAAVVLTLLLLCCPARNVQMFLLLGCFLLCIVREPSCVNLEPSLFAKLRRCLAESKHLTPQEGSASTQFN